MAGSGRLLIPLAEEGFRMHGVDSSEAMLASCGTRLRDAGREARLFRQNIAALNVPFRYGATIIAAGSLQLITAPKSCAQRLPHPCAPDRAGTLLLDLFVPEAALHPPVRRWSSFATSRCPMARR
jgi:hypothetical protein